MQVWTPPPSLTVSEWADTERMLSAESSAEPGRWSTARAEYLRGPMDAVSDPEVGDVVLMMASQVGKTSLEENVVGFHVDQDPSPMLVVLPILELAAAFSKDRLAPMLRDTPALQGRIGEARSRDGDNTLLHKMFPGGHITLAGANSPASLSARPVRVVLGDEIDRWPASAGTEGDPLRLAKKRTEAFWNRKHIWASTPTLKGLSRIEAAYQESDRREFWVPCPHCGEYQTLVWAQVRWPEGEPERALYHCPHCGSEWTEGERKQAVALGEWRASAPFHGTAGFRLNGIYSPWTRLGEKAREWLEAQGRPAQLQVFINTFLAETWEEDAERVDAHALEARAEDWAQDGPSNSPEGALTVPAPADVLVITCGVDVQDDRLEVERVGWGLEEESWSLEHRILYGDPSAPELWKALDDYLTTSTPTADGRKVAVSCTAIDSGGHHTQAVYRFCGPRFGRRVYAIKGSSTAGAPVWPKRASKNNKARINLFMVGVNAAKDMVTARFKVAHPGPGYCHFPKGRDGEYFRQLTAERVVTRYSRGGFPVREWRKEPSQRNEALDCRVYAYAALVGLNVKWGHVLRNTFGPAKDAQMALPLQPAAPADVPAPAPAPTESPAPPRVPRPLPPAPPVPVPAAVAARARRAPVYRSSVLR